MQSGGGSIRRAARRGGASVPAPFRPAAFGEAIPVEESSTAMVFCLPSAPVPSVRLEVDVRRRAFMGGAVLAAEARNPPSLLSPPSVSIFMISGAALEDSTTTFSPPAAQGIYQRLLLGSVSFHWGGASPEFDKPSASPDGAQGRWGQWLSDDGFFGLELMKLVPSGMGIPFSSRKFYGGSRSSIPYPPAPHPWSKNHFVSNHSSLYSSGKGGASPSPKHVGYLLIPANRLVLQLPNLRRGVGQRMLTDVGQLSAYDAEHSGVHQSGLK